MTHVYEGQKFERATSRDSLAKRLEMNHAYASTDFDGWLMDRLNVQAGEDVLDVGCGTGAQSLLFAKRVSRNGSVSSIDISADSVGELRGKLAPDAPVQAEVGDMAMLDRFIGDVFKTTRYDLAQSTYALYYTTDRIKVLGIMKGALKPGGRLAVFTPQGPHGLVELAGKFSEVPQPVFDSLKFGGDVLAPWFKANFSDVEVHHFHNELSIPSADELISFYRATTYYDQAAEGAIRAHVEAAIARDGRFMYEKNGYLSIGRKPL